MVGEGEVVLSVSADGGEAWGERGGNDTIDDSRPPCVVRLVLRFSFLYSTSVSQVLLKHEVWNVKLFSMYNRFYCA